MLAASTVQVSAAGVLPWQTPQSMAEGIGGTWLAGCPGTKPVVILTVPLWQVWQVVTAICV